MKRLVILAYYFDPYDGVGAKRPSYWAKYFAEKCPEFAVEVYTATPSSEATPAYVNVIPDSGRGIWRALFTSDVGASWATDLKPVLADAIQHADIVLITGGPFMHFRLARWIKRRSRARVVLDFRDPMSNNPRFEAQGGIVLRAKWAVVRLMERWFVGSADLVITVNRWCLDLIARRVGVRTAIIDNGFDEAAIYDIVARRDAKPVSDKIRIVYAGSFYGDRSPEPLFQALSANADLYQRFEFVHVGKPWSSLEKYRCCEWFVETGQQSYQEAMAWIHSADYAAIVTKGYAFESTTKIFDYIGLRKNIIVFTGDVGQSGAMQDYAKRYPGITFVKNRVDEIASTLRQLKRCRVGIEYDATAFSRRAGAEALRKVLSDL